MKFKKCFWAAPLIAAALLASYLPVQAENWAAGIKNKLHQLSPAQSGKLDGQVYLFGPVPGARVGVRLETDRDSDPNTCVTDSKGMWQGLGVDDISSPLRLEVRGGMLGDLPFTGTLSAYLPARDIPAPENGAPGIGSNAVVNILTTVADRYMRYKGCGYAGAVEGVLAFFNIPKGTDIRSHADWKPHFNPFEFIVRSIEAGGFDQYVDTLVPLIGTGETRMMHPLGHRGVKTAKAGLGSLGGALFKGIGSQSSSAAVYNLLNLSGAGAEQALFNEIIVELENLDREAQRLSLKTGELGGQMGIIWDEFICQMTGADLLAPAKNIDYLYDEMAAFAQSPASVPGKEVDDFVQRILTEPSVKIDIKNIYSCMVGSSGNAGALEALKDLLLQKRGESEDKEAELARSYSLLQACFLKYISCQLKGAILVANALNERDGRDSGSAQSYLMMMQIYIDREVDSFLSQVERLVQGTEGAGLKKMGYGESELYDPVNNQEGRVLTVGSGTAVIFLESASSQKAVEGDTAGLGTDEVWFDLTDVTSFELVLDDEGPQMVAAVQILDWEGSCLITLDDKNTQASFDLPPGRYAIRLTSGHLDPAPQSVFLWFGDGASETAEAEPNLQGLALASEAQPSEAVNTAEDNKNTLMRINSCRGCDLTGANLYGANLEYANLEDANLAGANLHGANLYGAILYGANLADANLELACLKNAALSYANLRGAHMIWAYLERASLNTADLAGAKLHGANLNAADLSRANLSRAVLRGAYLRGAYLRWADLSKAVLAGANLYGADLEGANLVGAYLRRANLYGAKLYRANLRGADLRKADLSRAKLYGADLTGADLTGVIGYKR